MNMKIIHYNYYYNISNKSCKELNGGHRAVAIMEMSIGSVGSWVHRRLSSGFAKKDEVNAVKCIQFCFVYYNRTEAYPVIRNQEVSPYVVLI